MLNRKFFISFFFYFNNKLKQVQLIKSYSSYVVNTSSITIITYLNSYLEKDKAIKQNINKSGIYKWINVINNKSYIGSSINLGRRFKEYYNYNYISKAKRSVPIHNALLKYGYSSFKLQILEYCNTPNLIEREQHSMYLLNPKYIVLTLAG